MRRNGIADVFENVGSQQTIVAREAVHFHFGDRRGIGEVVERRAAAGLRIVVDIGRAVVTLREQRHSLPIGRFADPRERNARCSGRWETEPARIDRGIAASIRGNFRQTPRVGARIGHRGAIQIGSGRRRGGGRIRNFIGARGHDAHTVQIDAQALRRDLLDLGVQPLAHFGAAVIHLHAAVAINQHQRAGLIEKRRGEGNAELHGRDREPALAVRMRAFQSLDLVAPPRESARFLQPPPDDLDAAGILHRLAVVRGVAFAIEIAFADHLRRQAKPARRLIQNLFDHQHALRSAEAAKSGLRSFVRAADQAGQLPPRAADRRCRNGTCARDRTGSDRSRLQPPSE